MRYDKHASISYRGYRHKYMKNFSTITDNQIKDPSNVKCPYCGSRMELRSAKGIKKEKYADETLFVCKNHPNCDCYCRAMVKENGSVYMINTPADAKLRALRNEAHYYFDKLVAFHIFTNRNEAYRWLTASISLGGLGRKHIGEFNEYFCEKAIEECVKALYNNMVIKNIRFFHFKNKETNDKTYHGSLRPYLVALEGI